MQGTFCFGRVLRGIASRLAGRLALSKPERTTKRTDERPNDSEFGSFAQSRWNRFDMRRLIHHEPIRPIISADSKRMDRRASKLTDMSAPVIRPGKKVGKEEAYNVSGELILTNLRLDSLVKIFVPYENFNI